MLPRPLLHRGHGVVAVVDLRELSGPRRVEAHGTPPYKCHSLLLTLPTVPSPPHTSHFLPPSPTVPHSLFPHPRCVKSLQGRLGTEGRRRGTIAHDMRDMTAPSASLHQNPRLPLSIAQVSPSLCRNAGTHATALPSLPCTDRLRRGGTTRLRGHWLVRSSKVEPSL